MRKAWALAGTAMTVALFLGCESHRMSNADATPASLTVEASSRDIVVGELVTLVARTKDTYGRDAEVKWSSTAGSLTVEEDGRVARVKFTEVGTYTVRSALLVDKREVDTDLVEVRVRPVN